MPRYQSPFASSRVQNQFSGMFAPEEMELQDYSQPESDPTRYMSDVRERYAQTPALDAYREHLGQQPQAADYKPSAWDRVAAGLAGFSTGLKDAGGGIQVAQKMNRSGYDTALSDYYQQAKPLHEAAGLERQGIDDQVNYIMKANELGLKYDDYRRQVEKDQNDARIRQGELGVREGELGVKQDELGWKKEYEGKRLNHFDKDVNSMSDYRKQLGGAASTNASTGQFNARTGRMNAETNQGNIESLIDFRKDSGMRGWADLKNDSDRIQNTKSPTAANLSTAEQDELANLSATYPNFVTFENGAYVPKPPPDVSSPEYQDYKRFLSELQRRSNTRARTGQIDFGLDPAGDSPWELESVSPQ